MTAAQTKRTGTARLVDTIEDAEHTSLEAVRTFLDTVDSVIPHRGGDDGPRRKIIDSAFRMTEQLAQNFLDVTREGADRVRSKVRLEGARQEGAGPPEHRQAGTGSQGRSTEDRCEEGHDQASSRPEDDDETCVCSQGPCA